MDGRLAMSNGGQLQARSECLDRSSERAHQYTRMRAPALSPILPPMKIRVIRSFRVNHARARCKRSLRDHGQAAMDSKPRTV